MNWMEVALLLLGVGAFAASFIIPERKGTKDGELQIDTEVIRKIIEKETDSAKERVTEVVDETLMYAVEKAERASERISNEKIMAISEYSETVLAEMNKAHQEVMFLYDMLNDKHKNLKETVKIVDKHAKEVEEKASAAASALAAKEETSAIIEKQIQGQVAKKRTEHEAERKAEQRITLDMLVLPQQAQGAVQPMQTVTAQKAVQPTKIAAEQRKHQPMQDVAAGQGRSQSMQNGAGQGKSQSMQTAAGQGTVQPKKTVEAQPVQGTSSGQTLEGHKKVEVYSFAEQAPRVERSASMEMQAQKLEKTVSMMRQRETGAEKQQPIEENNNDRILRMYKSGMSSIDIARELGLGVGEVKLVINLFKGAV